MEEFEVLEAAKESFPDIEISFDNVVFDENNFDMAFVNVDDGVQKHFLKVEKLGDGSFDVTTLKIF